MFRFVIILGLVAVTYSSIERLQMCVRTHKKPVSNEYLNGTWHLRYILTTSGVGTPSTQCPNITYTVPTTNELKAYKKKYDNPDLPFKFDNNKWGVIGKEGEGSYSFSNGMYWGERGAKYFVLDPQSALGTPRFGYDVYIFQKIDDDLMMLARCFMALSEKWILSRNKNGSEDKIHAILDSPSLHRMVAQKYCDPPHEEKWRRHRKRKH